MPAGGECGDSAPLMPWLRLPRWAAVHMPGAQRIRLVAGNRRQNAPTLPGTGGAAAAAGWRSPTPHPPHPTHHVVLLGHSAGGGTEAATRGDVKQAHDHATLQGWRPPGPGSGQRSPRDGAGGRLPGASPWHCAHPPRSAAIIPDGCAARRPRSHLGRNHERPRQQAAAHVQPVAGRDAPAGAGAAAHAVSHLVTQAGLAAGAGIEAAPCRAPRPSPSSLRAGPPNSVPQPESKAGQAVGAAPLHRGP